MVEEHHETHVAHVLVDGERAYKMRKPVDLGYVSGQTRAERLAAATRELELGRRMSPQVYEGVAQLSHHDGRWSLSADPAADAEPVLVMRRLPNERRLDSVLADPDVPTAVLEPFVAAWARFLQSAPADSSLTGFGSLPRLASVWTRNFAQLPESGLDLPFSAKERRHLLVQTEQWLATLAPVLEERIAAGRVRDGHGDLRLEHVYLTAPPAIIDPLEFSQELRFLDVAADICFLAMELDELERPDAADALVRRFSELSADPSLPVVVPFFKRYRAIVRAKVSWLRSRQLTGQDRASQLARARRLVELALSYRLA